jgi:hypothetical protein
MEDGAWTYILQSQGSVLSGLNHEHKIAYWVTPSNAISYLEQASPLRNLLSLWMNKQGKFLTHGAAVGTSNGGVLILGQGGSGKSTTSIASMLGGLSYASDDYCLVSASSIPTVYSLYCTAKLAFEDVAGMPALKGMATIPERPAGEKVVFQLDGESGIRLEPEFEIRALFLARIIPQRETGLRRATPAEAFRSLTGSTSLHLPAQRAGALRCFSTLSRQVPCYVLELGSEIARIPGVISDFLGKEC